MTIYASVWENAAGVHRRFYLTRVAAFRATRHGGEPLWFSVKEMREPEGAYQVVKLLNRFAKEHTPMNENHVMPAKSGAVYWRDPKEEPPPKGVKLLILTSGGVTVIGDWMSDSNFTAWSPMPRKRKD